MAEGLDGGFRFDESHVRGNTYFCALSVFHPCVLQNCLIEEVENCQIPSFRQEEKVMRRSVQALLLVTLLVPLEVACLRTHPALRATPSFKRPQAGLNPEDQARVDRNCPEGMPKVDPKWLSGPVKLVAHDGYALLESCVDRVPLWVCESVTDEQLSGTATRKDHFVQDPNLDTNCQSKTPDYSGTGYDRGHQAPAGDQKKDQTLNDQTFYMSNMAPQLANFNRNIWEHLESQVRTWAEARGHVWVITGGMFYDPHEDSAGSADGIINYSTIGANAVAVPTHFYKIVVAEKSSGKWEAIAFVLENVAHKKPFNFAQYIKSIDWIEERTGIDFLPDLSPADETTVEAQASTMW